VTVRVVLPAPLRVLAKAPDEVEFHFDNAVTIASLLSAVEDRYPVLKGTLRDQVTHKRRPFVRFFACEQDLSHVPADTVVPPEVADGAEPFLIVGAIAGG
jgi:hypothetical protein